MSRSQLLSTAGIYLVISALAAAPTYAADAPATNAPAPAPAAPAADALKNENPTSLEGIVVTAGRLAKTARADEKTSTNVVNIQSAEAIEKYPDINAAEALRRIPGVYADVDEAEGRFVSIRGIEGNLNAATFGGAEMLNTNPTATQYDKTGRAVLFNSIPTGVIDRITVSKSWTPDHQADGLGGSVELTPRSALTHNGFFVEGKLGGGYQTERGSPIFDDELAIGDSFGANLDGGKLVHFVVSQSQHNDKRGFDDVEEAYADKPGILNNAPTEDKVYNNLQYRHYRYQRHRSGYSFDLDITPDSHNLFFVRGTFTGLNETVNRQILQYNGLNGSGKLDALGNPAKGAVEIDPLNPDKFIATDASVTSSLRDRREINHNVILQLGGKHTVDEITLDWMASYVRASFEAPYDRVSTFTGPTGLTVTYDNINNVNYPTAAVSGANVTDPTLFNLHDVSNAAEYSADTEFSYHLNVGAPLHLLENDQLKVGGELRYRHKYDMNLSTDLLLQNPTNGLGVGPSLASLLGAGPVSNFYGGLSNIGYEASASAIANRYGSQVALSAFSLNNPKALTFNDTENIAAGYIQYGGDIGAVHFLTGVRVENTKQILGGFTSAATVDPQTNATIPANTYYAPSRTYTNAFPSVHLVYKPTYNLQFRASYSTSIQRPGFYQTESRETINLGSFTINTGNQNLRPSYANNFDAGAYYYLPNSGVLSVSLFYKEISNFVAARTITAPRTINGITNEYQISSYSNVSGTHADGVEGNYVEKFTQLPGLLAGLGVDLNVLLTDSKVNLKAGQPAEPIPGMAAFNANAALFYEAHGLNMRLALDHTSKMLYTIGGAPTVFSNGAIATDVYLAPMTTLDATASYDINKHLNLYWSVKNITDAPLYGYEGEMDRPIHREYYGQSYEGGVRFKF